ncbi:hypothetical protein ACFW80_29675 [Streptomyces fimicarius]|uniref:hypothetical protein n=1 Tax=Streptomyces griseus TaxID=1911 RepID=UPI0036A25B86
MGGQAKFSLRSGPVLLEQETDHPRSGRVELNIHPHADQAEFTLAVRISGWSCDATATLNGEPIDVLGGQRDGYLRLSRLWVDGDTVQLDLGIAPRRVWAHPNVSSATGRTALQWGPLVFCIEGIDHQAPVRNVALPRTAQIKAQLDERTAAVTLHAEGWAFAEPAELYSTRVPIPQRQPLTAIPYFSWTNRGQSDMTVWIRETDG